MRLAPPSADRIRKERAKDWEATHPILLGQEKSLVRMLLHYIRGGGSQADHLIKQLRIKIDEAAAAQRVTQPGESLFDQYGRVVPAALREFCPGHADVYFDVGPQDRVQVAELFPGGPNELYDLTLPAPINMVSHRQQRPGLRVYRMAGAELYVSPAGYQLFNAAENCYWPSASSRPFSKLVTAAPVLPIADDIIVIQDRFGGDNFAHYLFDWMTRLGLLLESARTAGKNCVFVLGGIPEEFQRLLLSAVVRAYGADPANFLFPEEGLTLRSAGSVYWFSDQVETYMHPAQIVHPKSIEVIRKLSACIIIEGARFERIYISRGDTGRRRIANEDQVWRELRKYGFEMVRLADLRLQDQIAVVRGAKLIVAPHGMGLAHVALHRGNPTLLEIHNSQVGTDAFALMARAMGFGYEFALGTPIDNGLDDFYVPPEAVLDVLDHIGVERRIDILEPEPQNLVPGSSAFIGTWSPGAQSEELAAISHDVPELIPNNLVMRHVRRHPDIRKETNCGNWWGMPVDASRIYTATCWVWVPTAFDGQEVAISVGEWGRQQRVLADLTKRDCWQRLRATATAPPDAKQCAIVLRLEAPDGSVAYSTCWQLEPGPEAGEYLATP
jgi:hypothetical protein